jgi:hypothetical protein
MRLPVVWRGIITPEQEVNMLMLPLSQICLVVLAQVNLDILSKYSQVAIATVAYLGVGGSVAGWYIDYRITKFEQGLFDRMDAKFTTKEVCKLRHEQDPDWGRGVE